MGASTRLGRSLNNRHRFRVCTRAWALVASSGLFLASPVANASSATQPPVQSAGQPQNARPAPSPQDSTSQAPSTAAEQGQAQAAGAPGQAQANMEGLSVDPELSKKPMNKLQILGWTSLLSGLALGAGASAILNGAQTAEGSAQRILRRYEQDAGAHPIYENVASEYDGHVRRASTLRSTALALTVTAGVAFLTGVSLAIAGALKKKEPRKARIHGLSLRF